jgi:hypothetical protein
MTTQVDTPKARRSDLYLAAFLVTKKVKLLGMEGKDPAKKLFVFDATDEAVRDLEVAFSNRQSTESLVSALEYADNIRSMKRLCYG